MITGWLFVDKIIKIKLIFVIVHPGIYMLDIERQNKSNKTLQMKWYGTPLLM